MYSQSMLKSKKKERKILYFFILKINIFTAVKYCCTLQACFRNDEGTYQTIQPHGNICDFDVLMFSYTACFFSLAYIFSIYLLTCL